MLYRMYNKWAQAHGMTVEVLDYQDGDEAGMKSASMMVKGPNAYGLLKSENGVHRLVRVSPFDANARRQTSFASLEVMPELDNTIQVDIRPEDIEMQVFRSSGAGGQHINKTSSAVRLIHKPTGVVVSCQTQRSQFQNRDYAMEMLKAKLYQIAKQQHMDKIDDIKGVQNEIAWGHQIRSYVFMPYTMVKDHRTNYETGNVDAVMDGDLDGFIFAYLKAASRGNCRIPKICHKMSEGPRRWAGSLLCYRCRYFPVMLAGSAATCSGVPQATMRPPLSPPPGPRSIEIVGVTDHIQIVLDDHHSGPAVDETLEHAQQSAHIQRVQADGGLVEYKHGIVLPVAHLAGELEPLGLPARKAGVASPRVR